MNCLLFYTKLASLVKNPGLSGFRFSSSTPGDRILILLRGLFGTGGASFA